MKRPEDGADTADKANRTEEKIRVGDAECWSREAANYQRLGIIRSVVRT